jgi:membrane-bound ClpP family serine protease
MSAKFFFAIGLQLLGVIVIIAEFLIPSAGLLTILSVGLLAYSLFLIFTVVSANAGFMVLAADLITLPILVVVGLKMIGRSRAALHKTLSQEDGVSSQSLQMEQYVGHEGVAVSALRPAGIALIDGKRIDVVGKGEFINKNSAVIVVAVTGNQVIVKKKE